MTVISDSLAAPGTAAGTGTKLSRDRLSRIVAWTAARADRWRNLVRYDSARRWYHRMELTDEYEVWLSSWEPGQGTGYHDHGGSGGAFAVALGELEEHTVQSGRCKTVWGRGHNGAGRKQGGGAHGQRGRGAVVRRAVRAPCG